MNTKWALSAFMMVTYGFTVATAPNLALAWCNLPGIRGERTKIDCQIVKGQAKGTIIWYRPDSKDPNRRVGSAIIATCNADYLNCSIKEAYKDMYSAVAHSASEYTLVINAFSPTDDFGFWECWNSPTGYKDPCKKDIASRVSESEANKDKNSASVQVTSTSVFIFWITVILATNPYITTSILLS